NLGGGSFNQGRMTQNSTTLSGNSAGTDGGGIDNRGIVMLNNSTLSGNSATNLGGGIYNGVFDSATLRNVTLSNNAATQGGALYMVGGHTTVLTNTIVAYRKSGGNCFGNITSSKFTLSSDNTCAL